MGYTKEQQRAYAREHYKRNRERILAEKAAAYAANPDLLRARSARYREANPEKVAQAGREAGARYREKHKEELRAKARERYAKQRAAREGAAQ